MVKKRNFEPEAKCIALHGNVYSMQYSYLKNIVSPFTGMT